jgi:hypothetical protein
LLEQRGFELPVPFGPFILWMGCVLVGVRVPVTPAALHRILIVDVHAGEMAVSAGPGRISNGLLWAKYPRGEDRPNPLCSINELELTVILGLLCAS